MFSLLLIGGLAAFSLITAQSVTIDYNYDTTIIAAPSACTPVTQDPAANPSITSYSTSVIYVCVESTTQASLPTPLTSPLNPTVTAITAITTLGPIFTTIYTTTYINVCPTGTYMATYTITESCPGSAADYTPPTTAPLGFTVDIKICSAKANGACPTIDGGKVIVTEPCGCTKTGMNATNKTLWPMETGKNTGTKSGMTWSGTKTTTSATASASAKSGNGEQNGPLLTGGAMGRNAGGAGVGGVLAVTAIVAVAGLMFLL